MKRGGPKEENAARPQKPRRQRRSRSAGLLETGQARASRSDDVLEEAAHEDKKPPPEEGGCYEQHALLDHRTTASSSDEPASSVATMPSSPEPSIRERRWKTKLKEAEAADNNRKKQESGGSLEEEQEEVAVKEGPKAAGGGDAPRKSGEKKYTLELAASVHTDTEDQDTTPHAATSHRRARALRESQLSSDEQLQGSEDYTVSNIPGAFPFGELEPSGPGDENDESDVQDFDARTHGEEETTGENLVVAELAPELVVGTAEPLRILRGGRKKPVMVLIVLIFAFAIIIVSLIIALSTHMKQPGDIEVTPSPNTSNAPSNSPTALPLPTLTSMLERGFVRCSVTTGVQIGEFETYLVRSILRKTL
jgi:hypothetical protein